MTPELKDKWLAALRSGEYIQGTGVLRADIPEGCAYCCLGVLAEQINGIDAWEKYNAGFVYEMPGVNSRGCGLNLSRKISGQLVNLNDSERLPFPEIADWIEANV